MAKGLGGGDEKVLVLDFGAQYAHLIARRVRELSVFSELVRYDASSEEIMKKSPSGLILSGSPRSVHEKEPPRPDRKIFSLGIPVLGICYGLQVMVDMLGGDVVRRDRREYGRSLLEVEEDSNLLSGLGGRTPVWMSHGDAPTSIPQGFTVLGHTENSPYAAIRDRSSRLFGVQFHPEVSHTPEGMKILRNFLFNICGCKGSWRMESFIENSVASIRERVRNESVLCALSGGIDSTVTAILVQRAVGDNLTCLFVDHGLLRKDEAKNVLNEFKNLNLRVEGVDASDRFLGLLEEIGDPEEKRKIIGEEFIKVFTEASINHGPFHWLAQGTLYPDVIESAESGGSASRIKSHHNVAGLPKEIHFELIEPLRDLYKDEVRKIAKLLEVPITLLKKHPFPGPGLAVRIIGRVTREKLRICREASAIVEDELEKASLYDKVWQAFAMVGDDVAVGVQGDERVIGHLVTIRVVESVDAMTADWSRLPHDLLETMSSRITNEVQGASWVTYAISSKPPSTIEPQ